MVRQLDGYGRVAFPECHFEVVESEERGLLVLSADFHQVRLKLLQSDRSSENGNSNGNGGVEGSGGKEKVLVIKWSEMRQYAVCHEEQIFVLVFLAKAGLEESKKTIRILTGFVSPIIASYMCVWD